jgi:diguanylate cyclase (GGDEF)-like protein
LIEKEQAEVSPILTALVTAAGGVLAGLAAATPLLVCQQQALTRAHHDATHDDTTGLPNRRALLTHLSRALAAGRACGVVLLDLDAFKTVNDHYGHETGNDLLTAVGRRLAALPAPVVLAVRLSGDEFALLVHGNRDAVTVAARHAWQTITATPIRLPGADIAVGVSVGYATARLGLTPRQLLACADEAMYRAKTSGIAVAGHTPAAGTAADARDLEQARPRYRDRRH